MIEVFALIKRDRYYERHVERAELYITPRSFYKIKALDISTEMKYSEGIGLVLHGEAEPDAVIECLRQVDWLAYGRPAPNGRVNITCRAVKHALREGGFIDG